MSIPKEDGRPGDNMELLKQQASACDSSCGCHASTAHGKARWVIGALVLAAAGAMVVHAMVKNGAASSQASATASGSGGCCPSAGSGCCPK